MGLVASIQVCDWKDMIWKWAHPRHLPKGRPLGPHDEASPKPTPPNPEGEVATHKWEWGKQGSFWSQTQARQTQENSIDSRASPNWDNLPKPEQAHSQELTMRYQEWLAKAEDFSWAPGP